MTTLMATVFRPCKTCNSLWHLGQVFGNKPSVGDRLTIPLSEMTVRFACSVGFSMPRNAPLLLDHCIGHRGLRLLYPKCIANIHWSTCNAHNKQNTKTLTQNDNTSDVDNISLDHNINISRQACLSETELPTDSQHISVQHKHVPGKKSKKRINTDWIEPEGLDTGIKIYNSLTRQKEHLILPAGRLATWYACGPTVYDHAHIGHASSYVRSDIVRRVLMNFFNIDVVMVMGITDIDDKIIKRSEETGVDFRHLSRHFETEFFKDMDSLKVVPPTVKTRVSDYIPHIIKFTQNIVDNGYGYMTSNGTVYFDVGHYGQYGKLRTHLVDDEYGSRVPVDTGKKNMRDFALWKTAKPGEPWWESPWGNGRPGWHIECSTMASTIFGKNLDIHSGGDDLMFPHHENEMAQSHACFNTTQWTNYWVHTGFLHLTNDNMKMSKSLKNTVRISDLLKKYTANQFRLFCMMRPYRQAIEYNEEVMQKAVNIHNQWASFQVKANAYVQGQVMCKPVHDAYLLQSLEEAKKKIEIALADDFDTPKAVGILEELVARTNIELQPVKSEAEASVRSPGVIAAIAAYVDRIMDLFGVQVSRKKQISRLHSAEKFSVVLDSVMKFRGEVRHFALNHQLAEVNNELTKKESDQMSKQQVKPLFQACDSLRDDLKVAGIKVQDLGGDYGSWDMVEHSKLPPSSTPRGNDS